MNYLLWEYLADTVLQLCTGKAVPAFALECGNEPFILYVERRGANSAKSEVERGCAVCVECADVFSY